MKIIKQGLTIIDFIRHPLLLNDQTTSPSQLAFLKAFYGLDLSDREREICCRGTGRETYVSRVQRETTLLAGRRAGKTKLAAIIASYEAFRDHRIPRGEHAYVMLIAPTLAQAKLAFDYILKNIQSSEILSAKIKRVRGNEVELKNGIIIGCYPCSRVSVRGRSAVAIICDEICFWRNEVTSIHNDEEVLAALRPSMASFSSSKLIKISTPNIKRGVVYEELQRRGELDYDVWHLTTQELNPTVSDEFLEAERKRSPEDFNREYLAQFVDSVTALIDPELLARCVINGRRELPPVPGMPYAAAIDAGFRRSDFGMAIAHRTDEGLILVDCVPFWTGSKHAPLGFQWVCGQVAGILRQFGINVLKGDQYCAVAIKEEFLKLGISYDEVTFSRTIRAQIFNNLLHLIVQGLIELPDHPELLRQLRSLEIHRSTDGSIDVRPAYGQKDDLAVVVALCVFDLLQSANNSAPVPISFGHVTRSWEGLLPGAERRWDGFSVRQLDCPKFPKCCDTGTCTCY